MKTIITQDLQKIKQEILDGGVVCIPTDTIYGLSASVYNNDANKKIFQIKGRDDNKPLIVLLPKDYDIEQVATITPLAKKLIAKYWPGEVSIILKHKMQFCERVSQNYSTIAFRVPKNTQIQKLLEMLGQPITSTSANKSGEPTPTSAKELKQTFDSKIKYILQNPDEQSIQNTPSTIVDATGKQPIILRQGKIKIDLD